MGTVLATTWSAAPSSRSRPGASTGAARRPVLAAVDVSDGADLDMARRVLRAARRHDGPLHVVHACHIVGESTLACGIRGVGRASMRLLRKRTREDRLRRLSALVDDRSATLHVLHGRVHRVVDHVARRLEAALVVLGSPSPSVIPGLLPGGTVALLSGGVFPLLIVPRHPIVPVESPRSSTRPAGSGGGPVLRTLP